MSKQPLTAASKSVWKFVSKKEQFSIEQQKPARNGWRPRRGTV